jgi:hypothetical protein
MKLFLFSAALMVLAFSITRVEAANRGEVDLTGTWVFSVDLDTGGHGDPTFVFKQEKSQLSGSYDGPLGKHQVTGKVEGNKAVFGFEFEADGQTATATYSATVESDTKMSGTLEIANGPSGKWTGKKK